MYTPKPINTEDTVLEEGLLQLAELLAENVHDNWAAGRIAEGWTYGETAKAPTSTAAFGKAKYTYAARGSDTYTATVPTQAGEYTVKAAVDAAVNYPAGVATKDFTIARAGSVAATVTADSRIYDGAEKPLAVAAGEAAGGTMNYALGTAAEATEAYTPSIPSAANAGTYYVWYKVVGDANHSDSAPVCVTVKIAALAVAPSLTGYPYYYDGNEHGVTATGASGGCGTEPYGLSVLLRW